MSHPLYRLTAPAAWAAPPRLWSYSTLRKARACPRSLQLERSAWSDDLPTLPELPNPRAATGTLIHDTIEHILRALVLFGLPPLRSPAGRAALRHADYVGRIERGVAQIQHDLHHHPRARPWREPLDADALRNEVSDLVQKQYAALLARRGDLPALPSPTAPSLPTTDDDDDPGLPLAERLQRRRVLTEARITHATLRVYGTLDTIYLGADGVVIADFKTGRASDAHRDQLALYAALWRSATGRRPDAAEVIYFTETRRFTLSDAELDQLEDQLRLDIERLDHQLLHLRPAQAHPGEPCTHCHARPFCDAYWSHLQTSLPPAERLRANDLDLTFIAPRGDFGLTAEADGIGSIDVTLAPNAPLRPRDLTPGARLRILNARWSDDDQAVEITPWSEVFVRSIVDPQPP